MSYPDCPSKADYGCTITAYRPIAKNLTPSNLSPSSTVVMKPLIRSLKAVVIKKVRNLRLKTLFHPETTTPIYELSAEASDSGYAGQHLRSISTTSNVNEPQLLPENVPLPSDDDNDDESTHTDLFPGFDFEPSDAEIEGDTTLSVEAPWHTDEAPQGPEAILSKTEQEALWQTQQALRDPNYIHFDGEDDNDYTAGPIRMVVVNDGVSNVTAMLLNMDLSQKFQRAFQFHQTFAKHSRMAEMQEAANNVFINKLHAKIRAVEAQISQVEALDATELPISESSWLGAVQPIVEKHPLQVELEKLELLLKNTEARSELLAAQKRVKAGVLIEMYADVAAIVEDAFINANLVQITEDRPDTPVEPLDVDNEWATLSDQMNNNYSRGGNEDTWNTQEAPSLSSEPPVLRTLIGEEQAREILHGEFYAARQALVQAEQAFDNREDSRKEEEERIQALYEQSDNQEECETSDQFDLRMLVRDQQLTRTLIDCEAEYDRIKRAAHDAGFNVDNSGDQTSDFADKDGGYDLSAERDWVARLDTDWVEDWMSQIPDDGTALSADEWTGEVPELDEWEGEEADISDSFSAVGYGRDLAKIRKWRERCGW